MARQAPKVKTERTVTKFDKNKKAIELLPKNDNQDLYIKSLRTKDQVVVFGPAGCKAGDTLVHYRRGKRNSSRSLTLREFVSKFNGGSAHLGRPWDSTIPTYIQSYNQDTGDIFYNKVDKAWYTGFKESVRIQTDSAGYVDITLDDKVLLSSGDFKRAGDVVEGDELLCKGSMDCPSKGSQVKLENKKKRVTVEGLKYYNGGWSKLVKENGITYKYKRNHKARLVVEADLMSVSYEQYVHDLKSNPHHQHKFILAGDLEVHHIDGDCSNDDLENLKVMTKGEHAKLHSGDNVQNFNREFTKTSRVISVENLGEVQVYDLTMTAPWHNFVVNDGIVTHNTGKTYVVATEAASLYHTKAISRIIITRPHVAVGKDVGFLPGTLEEKCAPWSLPVIDVLERHLSKGVVETGLKNGNIETAPLALMRGRSFDNAFVIVDEAQNITLQELKMVLTRIGEGSKLVLNGDIQQSDLKEGDGLTKIIHLIKKHCLDIPIVEFTLDDIVRSGITKEWVKVFTKEGV
jgi:phosphate starvation-inducible PhoH-like protein